MLHKKFFQASPVFFGNPKQNLEIHLFLQASVTMFI